MMDRNEMRTGIVVSLSVLFALTFLAPASVAEKLPSDDEKASSVVVSSFRVVDSVVLVSVKNLSRESQTVNVTVDVMVGTTRVRGMTPVAVFGGGGADVVVGFSDLVSDVDAVGIVEGGDPW